MAQDQTTVYMSPDGQHEMPLSSPAARLNWEARGWTPKAAKTATPANDKPSRQTRREAADE